MLFPAQRYKTSPAFRQGLFWCAIPARRMRALAPCMSPPRRGWCPLSSQSGTVGTRALSNSPLDCFCPPVRRTAGPDRLRCPHRSEPLGAGLHLCDRCPCSGSLFPPLAAVAFAAVLVPDGAPDCTLPKTEHKKKALLSSKAFFWCRLQVHIRTDFSQLALWRRREVLFGYTHFRRQRGAGGVPLAHCLACKV